jgi:hypothetical protein
MVMSRMSANLSVTQFVLLPQALSACCHRHAHACHGHVRDAVCLTLAGASYMLSQTFSSMKEYTPYGGRGGAVRCAGVWRTWKMSVTP